MNSPQGHEGSPTGVNNISDDEDSIQDDVVRLRAFRPRDYDFFYSLLASPTYSLRSRTRGTIPSQEEFRNLLWRDVSVQYVVESVAEQRTLGHVSAYNMNMRNGIAYLSVVGTPKARGSGLMIRACGLFVSFLFNHWPLRKLYLEMSESAFNNFLSGVGTVFVEEGRLIDFEYTSSGYHDLIIGSISREGFIAARRGVDLDQTGSNKRPSSSDSNVEPMELDQFLMAVSEVIGRPSLDTETSLASLDLDSLQILEIAYMIEESSGVGFDPLVETSDATTLRDLYLVYLRLCQVPPRLVGSE